MGTRWVVCAFLWVTAAAIAGEKYVAAGATTLQPIVSSAVREFQKAKPDFQMIVGAGGSDNGVSLCAKGNIQLGMVGRDLKAVEKEEYKDLIPLKVGLDGLVMVVNAKNPIEKISKAQVQGLYSGATKSWKDLGGPDAPVTLASRTKGHAQLELFANYFELEVAFDEASGDPSYKKKGGSGGAVAKPFTNNEKMLEAVLQDANAVTYLPVGFAQGRLEKGAPIRILELDGVAGSTANVANGTYPLIRPLLVVTKGAPQGELKEFLAFLASKEGRKIVADFDYVPIGAEGTPATK